jgi:TPR repeat protein
MLKSAESGYARACNNLGLYYKNGTGCDVDLMKAVYWLERAQALEYPKLAKKTLAFRWQTQNQFNKIDNLIAVLLSIYSKKNFNNIYNEGIQKNYQLAKSL